MPAQTRIIHYYVCLGAAGGKEWKVIMDEFLRDIHTLLFKEWILLQSIEGCDIKEENKKVILTTPYCHAEVVFNDHNLIELSVTNLVTDKIDFYLHFRCIL